MRRRFRWGGQCRSVSEVRGEGWGEVEWGGARDNGYEACLTLLLDLVEHAIVIESEVLSPPMTQKANNVLSHYSPASSK